MDPRARPLSEAREHLSLAVYIADRARTPYEWLTREGFHIPVEFQPAYLRQAPLLPIRAVIPFLVVSFACMGLLMLGWRTRETTWALLAFCVYILFADAATVYTLNRIYVAKTGTHRRPRGLPRPV